MSIRKYISNVPRGRYFWFLMLNVAVTGLASTMLGPFLPVFLYKQLGISIGAVSFLYFANGLAGTLTVLFMGWLVDRVGRKKVYAFGNSSAAIIPAAWAATTTLSQAFPIITISGVMDSASRTSQTTIIADQVEESKRNTAYGVSRIVSNGRMDICPTHRWSHTCGTRKLSAPLRSLRFHWSIGPFGVHRSGT